MQKTHLIVFLIASIAVCCTSANDALAEVFVSGGDLGRLPGEVSIAVPEYWRIQDFSEFNARLVVCAQMDMEPVSDRKRIRSELWRFDLSRNSDSTADFEGRQVLGSIVSEIRPGYGAFKYSVQCQNATAVYIEGWESGKTAVYSAEGTEYEIDWRVGGTSGYSFVHPVTWISKEDWPNSPTEYLLVCLAGNPGNSGWLVLIYELGADKPDVVSMETALANFGPKIIHGVVWQR